MTTAPPVTPPGHRVNWTDPALGTRLLNTKTSVTATLRGHTRLVAILVMLLGFSVLDAILIRPAMQRVFRDDPLYATITAIGFAAMGAIAAAMTGWAARGTTGNHPGDRRRLLPHAAAMALVFLLGVAIAVIRVTSAMSAQVLQYDQTTVAPSNTGDYVAALAFLIVYCTSATLAFSDFYHSRNDAATALQAAQATLHAEEAELRELVTTKDAILEQLAVRYLELRDSIPSEADHAKTQAADLAREGKEAVRTALVIGWGDPARAGVTHTGPQPITPTAR